MSATPLYVAAAGMACPLGLSAESAGAALRARMNRFKRSRYHDDDGVPMVLSELSTLAPELGREERVLRLLGMAVASAVRGLEDAELARLPLLVGTSTPERPGGVPEVFPRAFEHLGQVHGLRLEGTLSRSLALGNTAGLKALAEARLLLARHPRLPGCLVAAVDSFTNASSLNGLLRQGRLLRPDNSDGVIPGEAAACLLVTRSPRRDDACPLRLAGLGFGHERATLHSDEPLRGLGLAQAYREALAEGGVDVAEVDFRVADASGEGYGFKELSLALSRLLHKRRESTPLWLPAESLGETGAASGLVALAWASMAMRHGYAPGPRALISTSDSAGERATAVLRGPDTYTPRGMP
jgi:3-oxoacyl-[acyl-carrier-protein] synthase-1